MAAVQLGRIIAAKGGVVTAEEMAPYLDLPPVRSLPPVQNVLVCCLVAADNVDDCVSLLITMDCCIYC